MNRCKLCSRGILGGYPGGLCFVCWYDHIFNQKILSEEHRRNIGKSMLKMWSKYSKKEKAARIEKTAKKIRRHKR